MKLLTISIPTWNRCLLLNELLVQLVEQISEFNLGEFIDVLISDNASTDKTWELVTKFKNQYSFIKINKNHQNLGAKTNVLKSMELADSEFVMFLGDDDRIRKDCLKELTTFLLENQNLGVLIDVSKYKNKSKLHSGEISHSLFFSSLYWYMGNAGYFICKTAFIKTYLNKYGYDFFNECWPQTQLMILGLSNSKLQTFAVDFVIPIESKHDEVMIYSSYYLWRTCIYDLLISITSIRNLIPQSTFDACRNQMKSSIQQNFYNILQCGFFLDDKHLRRKTRIDIYNNLNRFSIKEKIYLSIIIIGLCLPVLISRTLGNLAIWAIKGKQGLLKKNTFVESEKNKISKKEKMKGEIRSLVFEK